MLGGPIGALFGAAFGHNFDNKSGNQSGNNGGGFGAFADVERIQTVFFTAVFSVMGHIAKADGQVSRIEILVAEDVMRQMRLDARQKQAAQRLFAEGKKADFDMHAVLEQFRRECHNGRHLLQMFLEIQVAVALSDGELHEAESRILEQAAAALGFSRAEYQALLQRIKAQRHVRQSGDTGMALADAYKLLGVAKTASDEEVKKAYRRQMNQHHPDKLVSKGLPPEMMELANKKAQDIKAAYEAIKQSRKN